MVTFSFKIDGVGGGGGLEKRTLYEGNKLLGGPFVAGKSGGLTALSRKTG